MSAVGIPNCGVGTSKWDRDCRTNLRELHRLASISLEQRSANAGPHFSKACASNAIHSQNPSCDIAFEPDPMTLCTYRAEIVTNGQGEIVDFHLIARGKPGTLVEGMEMTLHRDGTLDTPL